MSDTRVLLAKIAALRQRLSGEAGDALRRRLAFAGLAPDLGPRIEAAVLGHTRLPDVEPESLLTFEERRDLDRLAPFALSVPSGRQVALQYVAIEKEDRAQRLVLG